MLLVTRQLLMDPIDFHYRKYYVSRNRRKKLMQV